MKQSRKAKWSKAFFGKQGSVLIITLLVITTLTCLTIAFSEETNTEISLAGFSRDGFRAYQMARSGVAWALSLLEEDQDPDVDSYQEDWALFGVEPFPDTLPDGCSIGGKIIDESGKINLNALLTQDGAIKEEGELLLIRFFRALGIEESKVEPILDWLDRDNDPRMDGAEDSHYRGMNPPYACGNGPLQSIGQIYLIKGMKEIEEKYLKGARLTDFFTIWSEGMININTASAEVLQGLSDRMDKSIAAAIIEYRRNEDFSTEEDLLKVSEVDQDLFDEISPWITVKSTGFSIEAKGTSQDATAEVKTVAKREGEHMRLIYWRTN